MKYILHHIDKIMLNEKKGPALDLRVEENGFYTIFLYRI